MTYSIPPAKELRGIKGLWQYLITRSQLKAKIEIERERSKAYADHRDRLPENAELIDYEDDQGRGLWIRKKESFHVQASPELPPIMVVRIEPAPVHKISPLTGDKLTGETTL